MDTNRTTIKFLGMEINKEGLIKDIKDLLKGGIILLATCVFLYVFRIGCPIKFVTGIACPGCGMTRAVISLIRFDFKDAIMYHPMVFTLPLIIILYLFRNNVNKRLFNSLLIVIIAAFIITYIVRMVTGSRVVVFNPTNGLIYKIICYCVGFHL